MFLEHSFVSAKSVTDLIKLVLKGIPIIFELCDILNVALSYYFCPSSSASISSL